MPDPDQPPKGIVASATVTALANGSYNSFTKGYQNDTYEVRTEENNGDLYAVAVKI